MRFINIRRLIVARTCTICTGRENALYENSEVVLKTNTAARSDNHVDITSTGNNTADKIIKPVLSLTAQQTKAEVEMSTNASNIVQSSSFISSPSDDHIYGNQELLGRPIPVDELSSYVEEMCKRKDGFKEEYMVSWPTVYSFMYF